MGFFFIGLVISYIFLIILFLIGVPLFILSIIFLINSIKRKKSKTKKYTLQLVLSIIGICIGSFFIFSIFGFSLLTKSFFSDDEKNVETGTIIYWETDENIDKNDKVFQYNSRIYRRLNELDLGASFITETDEAVANIHYKTGRSKIDKLLGLNKEKTIYTIKNCNDLSLLADRKEPYSLNLYCDNDLFTEKRNFYKNMDNYNYFISKTTKTFFYGIKYEIISRPISETDFSFLKSIKYSYSDNYIEIPEKKNYEYINYFGKSIDGVAQIYFSHFLVDGEIIYYENNAWASSGKKRVVKIDDEYKNKILALLE